MRIFSSDVPIVAFEPNAAMAQQVAEFNRSDALVTVHPMALGEQEDTLTLFTPYYRGFVFDGLASMHRTEAAEWLQSRIIRFDPSLLRIDEQQVVVRRLDDFDLTPTFMKLRVQGFELAALRGGSNTIAAHLPVIMVQNYEDGEEQVAEFLSAFGYQVCAFDHEANGFIAGTRGSVNSFFLTAEHQNSLPMLNGRT